MTATVLVRVGSSDLERILESDADRFLCCMRRGLGGRGGAGGGRGGMGGGPLGQNRGSSQEIGMILYSHTCLWRHPSLED